jgi:hypothetical protein
MQDVLKSQIKNLLNNTTVDLSSAENKKLVKDNLIQTINEVKGKIKNETEEPEKETEKYYLNLPLNKKDVNRKVFTPDIIVNTYECGYYSYYTKKIDPLNVIVKLTYIPKDNKFEIEMGIIDHVHSRTNIADFKTLIYKHNTDIMTNLSYAIDNNKRYTFS